MSNESGLDPASRAASSITLASWREPWGLALLYTLFVVLFGAVVRITGSGAGCGQHWPTCHGTITHLPETLETTIEYTHRLTSGLSLVLVVVLTILTFRRHAAGHLARRAAALSLGFFVVESLIGALLVVLALVGKNDSVARAFVMALHLVNTSLLEAALLLAVVTSRRADRFAWRFERKTRALAGAGSLLLLAVSAAGAVTALGDTLYPVAAGGAGLPVVVSATDSSSHFLERVRGFHPLLGVGTAVFVVYAAARLGLREVTRNAVVGLVIAQVIAGLVNVALSAPGWMQVVHLALANFVWLAWVALVFESILVADGAPTQNASSHFTLLEPSSETR